MDLHWQAIANPVEIKDYPKDINEFQEFNGIHTESIGTQEEIHGKSMYMAG